MPASKGACSKKSSQESKKLLAAQKRILKRMENAITFDQIDRLLDLDTSDDLPLDEDVVSVPQVLVQEATQSLSEIPDAAPGYKLLDPALFARIFSEDGLKLTAFVPPQTLLYGHSANTLNATIFRKLLMARSYALRSDPLPAGVSRYVVYLMSCATSVEVVRGCAEFLRIYPTDVTPSEFVCLVLNLGVSGDCPYKQEDLPNPLATSGLGRSDLPAINLEKLMDYLALCVEKKHIPCDSSVGPLVSLLSKLGLDQRIRGSPLLGKVIRPLSLLARCCTTTLGPELVADWLLCPHDHPLNQLEVVRLLTMPYEPLQRSLLVAAIRRVLGEQVVDEMGSKPRIEPRDLRVVVRACLDIKSPLKVFTAMHLLISTLPFIKMSHEEFGYLDKFLTSMKVKLGSRDLADDVQLRGASMQLRSLLRLANVTETGLQEPTSPLTM